jgi:hypothetical protein
MSQLNIYEFFSTIVVCKLLERMFNLMSNRDSSSATESTHDKLIINDKCNTIQKFQMTAQINDTSINVNISKKKDGLN